MAVDEDHARNRRGGVGLLERAHPAVEPHAQLAPGVLDPRADLAGIVVPVAVPLPLRDGHRGLPLGEEEQMERERGEGAPVCVAAAAGEDRRRPAPVPVAVLADHPEVEQHADALEGVLRVAVGRPAAPGQQRRERGKPLLHRRVVRVRPAARARLHQARAQKVEARDAGAGHRQGARCPAVAIRPAAVGVPAVEPVRGGLPARAIEARHVGGEVGEAAPLRGGQAEDGEL